jgi:hypothetical protein
MMKKNSSPNLLRTAVLLFLITEDPDCKLVYALTLGAFIRPTKTVATTKNTAATR